MGDQPAFWLPALIGTALLEIAMQEGLAKRYAAALSFLTWALIAFAFALYSAIEKWSMFVKSLHAPPPIPYAICAGVFILTVPVFLESRRDVDLKESANKLAAEFYKFYERCVAEATAWSRNLNELRSGETEHRRVYHDIYGPKVVKLAERFAKYRVEVSPVINVAFQSRTDDLDYNPIRKVVATNARALEAWADLPNLKSWIRRPSFFVRIAITAAVVAVFWVALYLAGSIFQS